MKLDLLAPSNYFPGSSLFSFLHLVMHVIAFFHQSTVIPSGVGVRVQTRGSRSWVQIYLTPLFCHDFSAKELETCNYGQLDWSQGTFHFNGTFHNTKHVTGNKKQPIIFQAYLKHETAHLPQETHIL